MRLFDSQSTLFQLFMCILLTELFPAEAAQSDNDHIAHRIRRGRATRRRGVRQTLGGRGSIVRGKCYSTPAAGLSALADRGWSIFITQ